MFLDPQRSRARLWAGALAAWCLALAVMTLRDQSPASLIAALTQWLNRAGIAVSFDQIEALGNVGIFVPLGLFAQLLHQVRFPGLLPAERLRSAVLVAVAGGTASAMIEVFQSLLPDRVASFQDVILNALGTLLGALIGTRAATSPPAQTPR